MTINPSVKAAIVAIGTATPKYIRKQSDTAALIANWLQLRPIEKRLLTSVYKASGIDQRHSVLGDYCKPIGKFEFFPNDPQLPFPSTAKRMQVYKENALPLALAAIHNCFSSIGQANMSGITHLITVSCTGMYAPGIDIELVHQLKLHSTTKRTAINFMGCYGAFNALRVADAICKAESDATVLIVSVELCTIHFQKGMSMDNIISNAIFSDGAAAVLVQATPKQGKYFSLEQFHCDLIPQTEQQMAWHIADQGFDIALSAYVPATIKVGISHFACNLMNKQNLALSSIDLYAIHPGGIKILQACEEALNISKEDNKYSYQTLRDYGNMSSATILFVLKAMLNHINLQDHQKNIFSCAFGPGLTLEALLLKAHCS